MKYFPITAPTPHQYQPPLLSCCTIPSLTTSFSSTSLSSTSSPFTTYILDLHSSSPHLHSDHPTCTLQHSSTLEFLFTSSSRLSPFAALHQSFQISLDPHPCSYNNTLENPGEYLDQYFYAYLYFEFSSFFEY